jgi:hypothetical protein
MSNLLGYPLIFAACSLVVLWLSVRAGISVRRIRTLHSDERQDFGVILAATLTLLSLIIGFSFSMAISRYDQRKNYEEDEANTIGTEYLRAGLLSSADTVRVRALLSNYLEQRILFYETRDIGQLQQIDATTSKLETELWTAVQVSAKAQPSALTGLAASGMNDALNSQGYTQAAWWNHIPTSAWMLMMVMAICCNVLIGFGANRAQRRPFLFLVVPIVVSISFYLIADIDSPRRGIIRVHPQNLISLSQSLHTH